MKSGQVTSLSFLTREGNRQHSCSSIDEGLLEQVSSRDVCHETLAKCQQQSSRQKRPALSVQSTLIDKYFGYNYESSDLGFIKKVKGYFSEGQYFSKRNLR